MTDSLHLIDYTLYSVFVFHFSLESFLVALVPASLYFAKARISGLIAPEIVVYVVISVLLTTSYFVHIYGVATLHDASMLLHAPVLVFSGILAAIVFHGITRLPIWGSTNLQDNTSIDKSRRYMLTSAAAGIGGVGLLGALTGPSRVWWNSDNFIDVDLSKMEEGQHITVNINQDPVWIIKRSQAMLDSLVDNNINLYDPESNKSLQPDSARNVYRSIKPEYLVVNPTCTHLGCIVSFRPEGLPEWGSGQFANKSALFCPCHGGVFDIAGRVVEGTPPPQNLKVPDYEFISEHVMRIYYPSLAEVWSET